MHAVCVLRPLQVTQNEGVQLMASRAQMVDELEAAVPK